jgi:hypothetical protein
VCRKAEHMVKGAVSFCRKMADIKFRSKESLLNR